MKINGWVDQGGEDGFVWSGLCEKDSQDDFDSEYIGFDRFPDDKHGIHAFVNVRNVRCQVCIHTDGQCTVGQYYV